MHELSITESLINLALKHGQKAGATRITDLFLVIGNLSSVIDDSVQFYWDIVAKGTLAEGAQLHFRRLAVEMQCLACETHYAPGPDQLTCPSCQSSRVKIIQGDEFYLESINVET